MKIEELTELNTCESREKEPRKIRALCGWNVYFLAEVQSNVEYGNVYDIYHYNFELRTVILILCWYKWIAG